MDQVRPGLVNFSVGTSIWLSCTIHHESKLTNLSLKFLRELQVPIAGVEIRCERNDQCSEIEYIPRRYVYISEFISRCNTSQCNTKHVTLLAYQI